MSPSTLTRHTQARRPRRVKSLSQQEVDDLLSGAGMGLARAAELNQYPGPKHVLELADSLALNAEQRRGIERIFSAMQADAVALGQRILEEEKRLEALFSGATATDSSVTFAVDRTERLRSELRTLHLRAHLATRALLTTHQVHEYDRLRGYGSMHGK